MRIVGSSQGIFLTSTVLLTLNITLGSLAALGSRLIHNKRVSQPIALGVGAALPPQLDLEAIHVAKYAREHPNEDAESEAEVGNVNGPPVEELAPTTPDMDVNDPASEHGHKRSVEVPGEDAHKHPKLQMQVSKRLKT
eukprot:s25_g39.t1